MADGPEFGAGTSGRPVHRRALARFVVFDQGLYFCEILCREYFPSRPCVGDGRQKPSCDITRRGTCLLGVGCFGYLGACFDFKIIVAKPTIFFDIEVVLSLYANCQMCCRRIHGAAVGVPRSLAYRQAQGNWPGFEHPRTWAILSSLAPLNSRFGYR